MRISDWSSDVCSSDLLTEHAADIAPSHRQESSFVVILDGVEDYWVRNMDLMVDDARVLGIPVIFAGQSFRSGKRDMDEDMAEIGIEASKVIMRRDGIADTGVREDRKSTRMNSRH